jgi:hypothetical protein
MPSVSKRKKSNGQREQSSETESAIHDRVAKNARICRAQPIELLRLRLARRWLRLCRSISLGDRFLLAHVFALFRFPVIA